MKLDLEEREFIINLITRFKVKELDNILKEMKEEKDKTTYTQAIDNIIAKVRKI